MEKRFKRGLVLGKFMPIHNGHLHLINTAAEQCEKLFVMVCSLKGEPINGYLRYNWVKSIYENNKNIEIIHVQDENPQKPEELIGICPRGSHTEVFYKSFWVPTVYNRIKLLNAIFTSEDYGDEFAKYLSVEHVLVDIERKTHPISGTSIRNNPYTNWDFIPNEVKPYFTKRIVLMGPESTGKSTLVKKLATHYGVDYVEEYGRTYVETIKDAKTLNKEDFYTIATTHNNTILDKHVDTTNKVLFVDTEVLTTKIFGEMYLHNYKDTRINDILKHQWFDLYIVLDVDVPWVDDGTRDFPEERQNHFNRIIFELKKNKRNYVVIKGDYDERFESAKKEVDKILGYLK